MPDELAKWTFTVESSMEMTQEEIEELGESIDETIDKQLEILAEHIHMAHGSTTAKWSNEYE